VSAAADIRIRLSGPAAPGGVVEVTTLALAPPLADPAAGFDADGLPVPHYVGFEAEFDGRPLWRAVLGPGVSREVMLVFSFRPDRPGALTLRWRRRDGGVETRQVAVPAG
jgi:hypothetical protein